MSTKKTKEAPTFDYDAVLDAYSRDRGKVSYAGQENVFKPDEGKYLVRILPGGEDITSDPRLFFEQVAVHRLAGVNTNYYGCLKIMKDMKCPICNFVSRLYDSNVDSNIVLAREIKRYTRYMLNVIVRGQEEKGVQVWKVGEKIKANIIEGIKALKDEDEDWDVTHAISGRDYNLVVSSVPNQRWMDYSSSSFRFKASPLSEDTNEVDTILGSRFDLTKQYSSPILPPNELHDQMEQFLMENGLDALIRLVPQSPGRAIHKTITDLNEAQPVSTSKPKTVQPQTISEEITEQEQTLVEDTSADTGGDSSDVSVKLKSMLGELEI